MPCIKVWKRFICFRFAYKDEYEKFKLCLTVLLLLLSVVCYVFVSYRYSQVVVLCRFLLRGWSCCFTLCVFVCRFLDAILNFLLVWYYCTLTIRESILITNGSRWAPFMVLRFNCLQYVLFFVRIWTSNKNVSWIRIKGWWVFHHYISAFLSGVMLTWWALRFNGL